MVFSRIPLLPYSSLSLSLSHTNSVNILDSRSPLNLRLSEIIYTFVFTYYFPLLVVCFSLLLLFTYYSFYLLLFFTYYSFYLLLFCNYYFITSFFFGLFVYLLLFINYYFSFTYYFYSVYYFYSYLLFPRECPLTPFTPCTTQFPLSSDLLGNYRCVSELY